MTFEPEAADVSVRDSMSVTSSYFRGLFQDWGLGVERKKDFSMNIETITNNFRQKMTVVNFSQENVSRVN